MVRVSSPPARFRARALALLATALVCVAPPPGSRAAVAAAAEGPAAEAAAAPVETLVAAEVPVRADADERLARDVAERARQRDPALDLGPRLDGIADGVADLNASLRREDLARLSIVRLESIARHWQFYADALVEWRDDLERAMVPFAEDAGVLARRRAVWVATGQALATAAAPAALGARVRAILAQIEQSERALSRPLEAQIRLGSRANGVQASIEAGRRSIASAIEAYDRSLLRRDAPPVWQAWRETHLTAREIRGAEAGLVGERAFLREWTAANGDRLFGYQVAALMLLPLLLWLSYRSRAVATPEPGMEAATRVLRRPVSAWLVVGLVGLPFVFPQAPEVLHQLALLVAVVPVLRLLPPKVFEYLGPWPYIATALYVAYRLSFLLIGQPVLFRLYLLAVAVVTAGALAWLLLGARGQVRVAGARRVGGAVQVAGWLAVAALLVAVSANVAGNVTLAEMLTGAVLDSGYIGLALFAGATVVASMLNLVIARKSVSRFEVITRHTGPLLASLTRLVGVAALVTWLVATAIEFRVARPVFGWVRSVLSWSLEAGELSISLGSVALFAFAVWLAFWVAKTVRLLLRDEVLPKMALPRGVDNSVATLSYYAVIIAGLMAALAAAGFEASQFALVFGALGVGIGFGLQNVVNNFVSGLILMFERPIQPGDVVEVSGTSGKVRDIGMRATTLTTFEGADVIVPNGTLLSEKLINWTLSDMNRRIDVEVGVGYGSDPRRVIALLGEVASGTPGIVAEPAPAVVFKGLGASALEFGIRAWTHDFGDWVAIRTEMTARVLEALRREGLEIPFPQQDLNLRSVSPDAAARLADAARPRPPDAAC